MEPSKIEFTRVNNDINGNPRYVCHFLSLLTDDENERLKNQYSFGGISERYAFALEKAKAIGGRKFHNKQFGGGIVFQSYNIKQTENDILNLLNK